jgi:hypothetical protein
LQQIAAVWSVSGILITSPDTYLAVSRVDDMVHASKAEGKWLMSLGGEKKRKRKAGCQIERGWQALGVIEA